MASNLIRGQRNFAVTVADDPKKFTRIDDPELAIDAAASREKNNVVAIRMGLPAVGAKLVNKYGLEFEVESHVHVPTANTVQRWREGSQSDADLYPSIIPQNLSDKLSSFVAAVDRCTTKTLIVLDTMPYLRKGDGVPDGHWVDTIGNGGANLLFIDAAQIHETHFAHEVGHLWVQYVDHAEDERVMSDVSDPARLHQLSFIQSFVTDLRVNQIIGEKGFDLSVILEDQAASITSLGRAIEAGYRPESRREGVFMGLALAAQILDEHNSGSSTLAQLGDTMEMVTRLEPELARLATGFANAVVRHGFESKSQILASIDECLKLAFDYSGDGIDLERDLVIPTSPEPDFDKYPQWLEGAKPKMKCEVGRIMAREVIPDGSRWAITPGPLDTCLLSFELPDGTVKGPWTVGHSHNFTDNSALVQRIIAINHQNKERQMKHQHTNGLPNLPGQPRRFYMAGMGRFLTRVREAEWIGGEHPYAYAMNNPVTYTDPSGLAPCAASDCATFPGGPCEYAASIGDDRGHWGGVICCDGRRYACSWNFPANTRPGIKKCNRVHEMDHFDDVVACSASGYSRPGWAPGKDPTKEECNAEAIELACLQRERTKECDKLSGAQKEKCYSDYRYYICDSCRRMTDSLLCPKNKVPSYCRYCK